MKKSAKDLIKQEIKEGKYYNNRVLNICGLQIIIKNNADKIKALKVVLTLERAVGINIIPILTLWAERFYNLLVPEEFKKTADFIRWIYFMGKCE